MGMREPGGRAQGKEVSIVKRKGDILLFAFLAAMLLAASIAVTWQILTPSKREEILSRLTQEGLGMISAAQHYGMEVLAENPDAPPFAMLRFDRIGYLDGLSVDGIECNTLDGSYTLLVAPDGTSFDLIAQGPQGLRLVWDGVGVRVVPEARIE